MKTTVFSSNDVAQIVQHLGIDRVMDEAIEDYVMVNLLTAYGKELGYGTEVQLACIASDPKNPYSFLTENEFQLKNIKLG